jgi:hypothetical protein
VVCHRRTPVIGIVQYIIHERCGDDSRHSRKGTQ